MKIRFYQASKNQPKNEAGGWIFETIKQVADETKHQSNDHVFDVSSHGKGRDKAQHDDYRKQQLVGNQNRFDDVTGQNDPKAKKGKLSQQYSNEDCIRKGPGTFEELHSRLETMHRHRRQKDSRHRGTRNSKSESRDEISDDACILGDLRSKHAPWLAGAESLGVAGCPLLHKVSHDACRRQAQCRHDAHENPDQPRSKDCFRKL